MPELPEVEHAARFLRRVLRGRYVVEAKAPASRVFRGGDRSAFGRDLRGKHFERVERRGKWLLLEFEGHVTIASHLGMTGKWMRLLEGDPVPDHVRATLSLDDGARILYRDPRLFGRLMVGPRDRLRTCSAIAELGPDPLRDGVDVARLADVMSRSKRAVRVVLLDQTVLAGVGNILATEALFFAKVDPARPARSITRSEAGAIARGIEKAVERGMASFEGKYLREAGGIENPFVVYDRAGEPCPRCRTVLVKRTIGGRASTSCPRCQR